VIRVWQPFDAQSPLRSLRYTSIPPAGLQRINPGLSKTGSGAAAPELLLAATRH